MKSSQVQNISSLCKIKFSQTHIAHMSRRPSICARSCGSGYGAERNNGPESTTSCRAGRAGEIQPRTQAADRPNHSETRAASHLDNIFLHPPIPALHLSLCTISVKLHPSLSRIHHIYTLHDPVPVPRRHHSRHDLHRRHGYVPHFSNPDRPDPGSVNDVHNSALGCLIETCLIIPSYIIASRSARPRYHARIVAVRPASRSASAAGDPKRNHSKWNNAEPRCQHWAASGHAGVRAGLDYQRDCRSSRFCDFESVRGTFYRDLGFRSSLENLMWTPISAISGFFFVFYPLFVIP